MLDTKNSCFIDSWDSVVCYVKGEGNFRHDFDDYKAARPSAAKRPETLEAVRKHLGARYGSFAHGGEADDYCIIEAAWLRSQGKPYIIATIDKDLKQFPGLFFNLKTLEIAEVTEEEGYNFLLLQCLMGDAVDGIGGLRGVGPVKAQKILDENPEQPEQAILDAYQRKLGTTAGLLELHKCWNLVYMREWHEDLCILPLPAVFIDGR